MVFFILCVYLFMLFSLHNGHGGNESFKVDSFTITKELKPYDWFYIRVELPETFFSTSLEFITKEIKGPKRRKEKQLPTACLRIGGPPLPDISNNSALVRISNSSNERWENIIVSRNCFFISERTEIELTNEQISPGVLFIGLFNRIGSAITQAKMISGDSILSFKANIIIKSCINNQTVGIHCNLTIKKFLCNQFLPLNQIPNIKSLKINDQSSNRMYSCNNSISQGLCHQNQENKYISLDIMHPSQQVTMSVFGFGHDNINLLCYARYGQVPTKMTYTYYVDLNIAPLVIPLPKVGLWYFMVQPLYKPNATVAKERKSDRLCYSLHCEVFQCPEDMAGPNCSWARYMLQSNSDGFLAYMPKNGNELIELSNILLEPLLTPGNQSDIALTYFVFYITKDSSGKNIHIDLTSNTSIHFELYLRYGGLSSSTNWDYYYINHVNNSDNGSMFKLYDSSERRLNAYILYPQEGLWCIGLKHTMIKVNDTPKTTISLSIERCPNHCYGHGSCRFSLAGPNYYRHKLRYSFRYYYYCSCDGRYKGFDCNVQLLPKSEEMWHVIFLTASNTAAILPVFWAFHKKVYAECVIFICSGIASALYHTCDEGILCVLSYHVLQFMDFWLSFMAIVSIFIYLSFINEATRRTVQTLASTVTALFAINGPTKPINIFVVLALGVFGLVLGWVINYIVTNYHSKSLLLCWRHNASLRWSWISITIKKMKMRFRWCFLFLGLIALLLAALSWNFETTQTYWLWHSAWHILSYTSAFFFLCSKRTILQHQHQRT